MPTPDVGRASIRQELPENPAIPALGSIRWHGRTKPRSSSRTPGAPGNRWKRPPSAGTSRARPPGARCGLRQRVLQPDARRTRGRGDRGRTGREPDFVRAGEGGREDFLGAVRVRRRASGVRGVARDLVEYEIAGRDASDFHRPLSAYLNEVAALGCRVREVAEPGLDPALADGIESHVRMPNFLIVAAETGCPLVP